MIDFNAVVTEANKLVISSLQGADIDFIELMKSKTVGLSNGYDETEIISLLEVVEANRQLYFQDLPLQDTKIRQEIKELNESDLILNISSSIPNISNENSEIAYDAYGRVIESILSLYLNNGGAIDSFIDLEEIAMTEFIENEKQALKEERIACISIKTRKQIALLTEKATKAGLDSVLRGVLKDDSVSADIERWKADGDTQELAKRLSSYDGARIRGYLDYLLPDVDSDGVQLSIQEFIIGFLSEYKT